MGCQQNDSRSPTAVVAVQVGDRVRHRDLCFRHVAVFEIGLSHRGLLRCVLSTMGALNSTVDVPRHDRRVFGGRLQARSAPRTLLLYRGHVPLARSHRKCTYDVHSCIIVARRVV